MDPGNSSDSLRVTPRRAARADWARLSLSSLYDHGSTSWPRARSSPGSVRHAECRFRFLLIEDLRRHGMTSRAHSYLGSPCIDLRHRLRRRRGVSRCHRQPPHRAHTVDGLILVFPAGAGATPKARLVIVAMVPTPALEDCSRAVDRGSGRVTARSTRAAASSGSPRQRHGPSERAESLARLPLCDVSVVPALCPAASGIEEHSIRHEWILIRPAMTSVDGRAARAGVDPDRARRIGEQARRFLRSFPCADVRLPTLFWSFRGAGDAPPHRQLPVPV